MDGQWTYSYSSLEWINDTFQTKEEALTEAIDQGLQKEVWLGQLTSIDKNDLEFLVINIERQF